jgi:hypothetical protein
MSPKAQKSRATQSAFGAAALGRLGGRKIPWKIVIPAGVLLLLAGGFFVYQSMTTVPQGNNLYGLCRAYITYQMQFPETLNIIELDQDIPKGQDPNNPQQINYELTFTYVDGYGQSLLNTVTCEIKLESKLLNTPWQGIVLAKVLFDQRLDHGWADVYYPPDQKNPRRADDRNERLEFFFNGIPSLLANPPDLSLPRYRLQDVPVDRLRDL